jgi:DNA-binding CsgD family transcriptional regulator
MLGVMDMSINIRKGKAEDGGFILEGDIHVTPRELEALVTIADGHDNEKAAKKLGISYTTLRNHTYNIMKKLGATNRTQALVKAVENGMIVISQKRNLVKKSGSDYLVCQICGRVFTWDDVVMVQEKPFVVNHVKYEPPEWPKCPYDDCRAFATSAYGWERVRRYHPEYPEIPQKDVKYSTDEIIEEEYQEHKKDMEEREKNRE